MIKYQHWLTDARYDIETAEHMFATGRWFYVLFMCQQSIEKLAKGLFGLYFNFNEIPFTHNIDRLVEPIADKISLHIPQETWNFFGELSKYAANKRYTDYKLSLSQKTTQHVALRALNLSKEAFAWPRTLKPSEPKPEDTPRRPRP
ncbi:MAG: HEPN domain-containing protein [Deltaproteobacteria bacterium]|jgi:HEPN domain-containing protein|nr:HEPN domain-containing protein [Deltaproteobacteria bacterium]